jgi:hypothetical protein
MSQLMSAPTMRPPMPAPSAPSMQDPNIQKAADEAAKHRISAAGRASTILTSPQEQRLGENKQRMAMAE